MKNQVIAVIFLLIFFAVIPFTFQSLNSPQYKSINETEINNLAYNISISHEYKLRAYDCTFFSKDLKVELRKKGYNAFCVFGRIKIDGKKVLHNWVMIKDGRKEIFVEATQGNEIGIIPKEIYARDYYEIRRGICN